ncbi:MAG: Bax inhibitor-1/YccA family protein [Pseudomonadota bacterium]
MAFGPERKTMTQAQVQGADIDVGLRKYMLGVYNYMSLGVAFTGVVALVVAMQPALMEAIFAGPLKWVLFGGVLLSGFIGPRIIMTKSPGAAHAVFWVYAAMWGALLAPMFYAYTGESIVRVFFITAAAFAGVSLYGYTTKKDLAPMGAFLMMATIGILLAIVVNLFLQSPVFQLLLSIVVVLVFAGLTAYETQMIKNLYYEGDARDVQSRKSIFGAFLLYGSFVTMFIWLLQIFGVARE